MWKEAAVGTSIIFFLMLGVGVIGILAKIINHFTLRGLVKAAGSMSKSTHKLMKLVRAKYEHACMVHDRVDNVDAFVEKYIYEYRGFLFKVHTWRQLEIQSIWFAGILGILGAVSHFLAHGLCEQIYQYGALGAAEMLALFVISQLTDEHYKIEAVRNYMVDYLENVCAHKFKRVRQTEKERNLDVINPENSASQRGSQRAGQRAEQRAGERAARRRESEQEPELSINIEGEPRQAERSRRRAERDGRTRVSRNEIPVMEMESEDDYESYEKEMEKQADKSATAGRIADRMKERAARRMSDKEEELELARMESDDDEPELKEEAIRQILEEFLA